MRIKSKRRYFGFFFAGLLGGCFLFGSGCAAARKVTGPSGEPLYAIDCSGAYSNVADCLEKAGKVCGGKGYEILGAYGANSGNVSTNGQWGMYSFPQINREMVIKCREVARMAN